MTSTKPAFEFSPAFKRNRIPMAHSIIYDAHEAFLAERWSAARRLYDRAIALFEQAGLATDKLSQMRDQAKKRLAWARAR